MRNPSKQFKPQTTALDVFQSHSTSLIRAYPTMQHESCVPWTTVRPWRGAWAGYQTDMQADLCSLSWWFVVGVCFDRSISPPPALPNLNSAQGSAPTSPPTLQTNLAPPAPAPLTYSTLKSVQAMFPRLFCHSTGSPLGLHWVSTGSPLRRHDWQAGTGTGRIKAKHPSLNPSTSLVLYQFTNRLPPTHTHTRKQTTKFVCHVSYKELCIKSRNVIHKRHQLHLHLTSQISFACIEKVPDTHKVDD